MKILGRDLAILYVDRIPGDPEDVGLYDPEAQTIYIKSSINKAYQNRILRHEMAHAILDISGLTHLLDEKLEEAICTAMEELDANLHI